MKLRPYQAECIDGILREWEGNQSTLAVMPTGTGKTVVFSEIGKRRLDARSGRVMVIAHREELIHQAADKMHRVIGERPDIEMAEWKANESLFNRASVVVSTVQTLQNRMEKFKPSDFGTLIIDEAHHATAPSYRKIIDHFKQNSRAKLLGVTATPDRADEAALGKVFGSVAFEYGVHDAITDGWLVPIQQKIVSVNGLDFSRVRTHCGDLAPEELAAIMEAEGVLHQIASPTVELAGDQRTLVFAASIRHAEMLVEILCRHKAGVARIITGSTPKDDRRNILREYEADVFQYLVNVGVATEGFDSPGIRVVVMARPTKSRALYSQMLGRGTRPLPGVVDGPETPEARRNAVAMSAKPHMTVLDFVGNSGRHKLVHASDILGGNYEEEVVERADAMMEREQAEKPMDVLEALEKAEAEIREEKRKAEADRRKHVLAQVQYQVKESSPFDVLDIAPARVPGWHKDRRPTPKMVEILQKNGIKDADRMNHVHASQLIGEIFDRRQKGLCTLKQAQWLAKNGLPTDVTFQRATEMLDDVFKKRRVAT